MFSGRIPWLSLLDTSNHSSTSGSPVGFHQIQGHFRNHRVSMGRGRQVHETYCTHFYKNGNVHWWAKNHLPPTPPYKCGISLKFQFFYEQWKVKFTYVILLFRYVLINLGIVFVYYASYHEVDEEEYGGHGELAKEGLLTSFSLFLVSYAPLVTRRAYWLCYAPRQSSTVGWPPWHFKE